MISVLIVPGLFITPAKQLPQAKLPLSKCH